MKITNPCPAARLTGHEHPGAASGAAMGVPGTARRFSAAAEPRKPADADHRGLWDTIEHAARLWNTLGHPGRDRFGITALDRADRQYVWLDDPDSPYSWPMPL